MASSRATSMNGGSENHCAKRVSFEEIHPRLSTTTLDDDDFEFARSFCSETTDYQMACIQTPADELFHDGRLLPLKSILVSPATVRGPSQRNHSPSPSFEALVGTAKADGLCDKSQRNDHSLSNDAESVGSSATERRRWRKLWSPIMSCRRLPSAAECTENHPQTGRKQNQLPADAELDNERIQGRMHARLNVARPVVQNTQTPDETTSKKPAKGLKKLFKGFQAKDSVRSTGGQHHRKDESCAVKSEKKSRKPEWLRKMMQHPFSALIKSKEKGSEEAARRAKRQTSRSNVKAWSCPSSPAPRHWISRGVPRTFE